MAQQMTPNRPYLVRAFFDWIVDNSLTPYLLVNAEASGVQVPAQYVKDGQIVLNIAPQAVGGLDMGLDAIRFNARFGGVAHQIYIPLWSVQAIYARENGAGTMFSDEEYEMTPDNIEQSDNVAELRPVVDAEEAQKPVAEAPKPMAEAPTPVAEKPQLAEVDTSDESPDDPTPPSGGGRKRPHLTLVK